MPKKKNNNCIHKYKRVNLTRNPSKPPYEVFKCVKPFCTNYIAIHLAENKECECWRCSNLMTISKKMIQQGLIKIHCEECTRSNRSKDVNTLAEILEKVIPTKE